MPSRVENSYVTARVQRANGTWIECGYQEDRVGGHSDSSAVVYSMGSIGKIRRTLGGRPEPGAVTVRALYDEPRQAIEHDLRARAGKGAMSVTEQPTNDDEEVIGPATTWTGILKMVGVTDTNMNGNAAKQLELEMHVESVA